MPIQWTTKLAVGVPQIDEEHQELFARVNKLLDAMARAKAREEIEPVIGFLSDYVTSHFGGEQRLMQLHRYPGAAEHVAQHAYFVGEFKALAAEVQKGGPTALVTIKLNKLLCDWLRDHVGSTDRKFGEFLRSAGLTARA
jgi:hemerythrin